ncbi:hypothetical protein NE686_18050 [Tissierella carlieri]|uniref:Uncharacterized protein n=1 Tax=Tissierella carlieri TaxID=689904 RepID=A0ABT1SEV5_9FIRM|nr:hypothetical protein [Tissierella carlieri]MCQ4925009.1 hypothetical protein [Tissierella carlieri]
MNKRQRKKKSRKCIPIIPDETNLLFMSEEERELAFENYQKFVSKYGYRKKYINLRKHLFYVYPMPMGENMRRYLEKIAARCRKREKPNEDNYIDKIYRYKIEAVEDIDGVSDYVVSSDKPIPQKIIDNLKEGYVGINFLKLACNLHGYEYEKDIEDED